MQLILEGGSTDRLVFNVCLSVCGLSCLLRVFDVVFVVVAAISIVVIFGIIFPFALQQLASLLFCHFITTSFIIINSACNK